jgi:hypothetical protein
MEQLKDLLPGTWQGPRWEQTLLQQYALTIDPARDYGPVSFRFELKADRLVGIARYQSATIDAEGRVWLLPPREFLIDEITFTGDAIRFRVPEESTWMRYEMVLVKPGIANLAVTSSVVRGHGEITRSGKAQIVLKKTE